MVVCLLLRLDMTTSMGNSPETKNGGERAAHTMMSDLLSITFCSLTRCQMWYSRMALLRSARIPTGQASQSHIQRDIHSVYL
jgi:hypothetical protein